MRRPDKSLVLISRTFLNDWEASSKGTSADQGVWGRMEVNVVFTNSAGTLAALEAAGHLARNLRARIRLLAPVPVPFRLPLDKPAVPLEILEKQLWDIAAKGVQGSVETSVHLYLCRDKLETLGQVLPPKSLVVIGGRRWWPNDASYLAGMLRRIGHHTIFVGNAKPVTKKLSSEARFATGNEVAKHA